MLKLPDRLQLSEELITNYKHKYCPYLGRTLVREKSEKLWSESIKSKSEKKRSLKYCCCKNQKFLVA